MFVHDIHIDFLWICELTVIFESLMAESEFSQEKRTDDFVASIDKSWPMDHTVQVEPKTGR